MNYKSAFPSKYLKAADLHEGSDPITVTIDHISHEDVGFGNDKDLKLVAYFRKAKKGLVLNVTNANKIAALSNNGDTDEWEGLAVELYVTETQFAGNYVDCIRIRRPGNSGGDQGHGRGGGSEPDVADDIEPEPVADVEPQPATEDDIPF